MIRCNIRKSVRAFVDKHPRAYHMCENMGHAGYFSLVFLQGHGIYTYFAGVMCVFVVINIIRDDDHAG